MSISQCIGKSRNNNSGVLTQCSNSGEATNPARPEWGFLCGQCSGAAPNRLSRPTYQVEHIDLDKPEGQELSDSNAISSSVLNGLYQAPG